MPTWATGSFLPLCPWPSWGLGGVSGNRSCVVGSNLVVVLDDAAAWDPASVDGAAAAKPLPRPRAARPRTPAMALEAANCLMVLIVVMICGAFQVSCRAS